MKGTLVAISLSIFLLPSIAAAQTSKPESWATFLSIVVGFGSGHFLLDSPKAPIFFGGEAVALGTYLYAGVSAFRTYYAGERDEWRFWYNTGMLTCSVFLTLRLWEILDIFGIAIERKRAESQLMFEPTWELKPDNISLGVKMRL